MNSHTNDPEELRGYIAELLSSGAGLRSLTVKERTWLETLGAKYTARYLTNKNLDCYLELGERQKLSNLLVDVLGGNPL